MRCFDCAFAHRVKIKDDVFVECRRYAPRPLGPRWSDDPDGAAHTDTLAFWPQVLEHEWCGEFVKRGRSLRTVEQSATDVYRPTRDD